MGRKYQKNRLDDRQDVEPARLSAALQAVLAEVRAGQRVSSPRPVFLLVRISNPYTLN